MLRIDNLPEDEDVAKDLWSWFSLEVSDKILKKKVPQAFRPFVSYKFGRHIDGPFLRNAQSSDHRLVQSFSIAPHLDQGYVFSPVLIYMPLSDYKVLNSV